MNFFIIGLFCIISMLASDQADKPGKVPSLLQLAAMKAATLVDKQPKTIEQLPLDLQYLLKLPYIKHRWSDFFVRTPEVIALPEGQTTCLSPNGSFIVRAVSATQIILEEKDKPTNISILAKFNNELYGFDSWRVAFSADSNYLFLCSVPAHWFFVYNLITKKAVLYWARNWAQQSPHIERNKHYEIKFKQSIKPSFSYSFEAIERPSMPLGDLTRMGWNGDCKGFLKHEDKLALLHCGNISSDTESHSYRTCAMLWPVSPLCIQERILQDLKQENKKSVDATVDDIILQEVVDYLQKTPVQEFGYDNEGNPLF